MKVNVNLPLTDNALSFAIRCNEWFVRHCGSEIVFSKPAPYPHLTLLMGTIADEDAHKVTTLVQTFAQNEEIPSVALTPPYRPDPVSPYVFVGVADAPRIRNVKLTLAKYLAGNMSFCESGNIETVPHVTVAYVSESGCEHAEPKQHGLPDAWVPRWIALSHTGKHGTCMGVIRRWRILKPNQASEVTARTLAEPQR